MPRPKNKSELIDLSQKNLEKLINCINSFSQEEQLKEFPPGTMNRNIRDVLMHLHHWHLLMAGWYEIGMSGEKPEMPAKGYSWKLLPELNKSIFEMYQETDLKEAKKLFKTSYENIRMLILQHTDAELFEKKRYKWTGSTSLGAYLVSSTSSQYAWAFKLIKKAKK